MNMHNSTTPKALPHPAQSVRVDENRTGWSQYDVDRWVMLTGQVREIGEHNGFSLAEIARRIDMPGGTFSQWYHGKYEGRLDEQNRKVALWVEAMEEAGGLSVSMIPDPGYIKTRTAKEFEATLQYAHKMRRFVIITAESGMGKTMSFERYCATNPHAYLVTASPYTSTVHAILNEIAAVLGVRENDASKRARAIGAYLSRNNVPTLLIIDEAQNLVDKAVDQVRRFVDIDKIGVAIGGNTEIYGRFANKTDGPSYAQIKRRVAKRIKRERPYGEDIEAVLDGWKISDPEARKFLSGLAVKDGALGNIGKTMEQAHLAIAGTDHAITRSLVMAAWKSTEMEGF